MSLIPPLYFVRPNDNVLIAPVPDPVLDGEGLLAEEDKSAQQHPEKALAGYP
ncbi:hypothetical protein PM082_002140 [Marasmius tenuissimus]|nr:hypothetical protein PM082_002140 [Marasmius tenuissimus]